MSIRPPTLAQVRVSKVDKVPEGWFTRAELQKEWGLAQAQTLTLIKQSMAAGKVEVKKFNLPHPYICHQSVPHYRFK
jgi:hypothetical protein